MMRRNLSTEASRRYWRAVDRLLAEPIGGRHVVVGEAWADSHRDVDCRVALDDEPLTDRPSNRSVG